MKRLFQTWACLVLALPSLAWCQVSIVRASATELPSTGGKVVYTVKTDGPGDLTVQLLTSDGDLVRELRKVGATPGTHEFTWDGKDARGQAVPDEAYCVRATLQATASRSTDDPCARTGGEVLSGIQPSLGPGGDIVYTLDRPARVLIRVGIKNGAMLRSLSVWRPRPAGRNLQRWNGFDASGLVDLRNDRLALLVTAFRLPDFAVITTGQSNVEYRAWRQSQGWPERPDDAAARGEAQPLERQGQRIARQHYMARYKDSEPRITVTLLGEANQPLPASASLPKAVRVSVDLHPDDRWLMQEQLYEVAFFLDGEFVSEEENGYTPIGWVWDTTALKPGPHLLTVNLTGFTGRVGTHTVAITK